MPNRDSPDARKRRSKRRSLLFNTTNDQNNLTFKLKRGVSVVPQTEDASWFENALNGKESVENVSFCAKVEDIALENLNLRNNDRKNTNKEIIENFENETHISNNKPHDNFSNKRTLNLNETFMPDEKDDNCKSRDNEDSIDTVACISIHQSSKKGNTQDIELELYNLSVKNDKRTIEKTSQATISNISQDMELESENTEINNQNPYITTKNSLDTTSGCELNFIAENDHINCISTNITPILFDRELTHTKNVVNSVHTSEKSPSQPLNILPHEKLTERDKTASICKNSQQYTMNNHDFDEFFHKITQKCINGRQEAHFVAQQSKILHHENSRCKKDEESNIVHINKSLNEALNAKKTSETRFEDLKDDISTKISKRKIVQNSNMTDTTNISRSLITHTFLQTTDSYAEKNDKRSFNLHEVSTKKLNKVYVNMSPKSTLKRFKFSESSKNGQTHVSDNVDSNIGNTIVFQNNSNCFLLKEKLEAPEMSAKNNKSIVEKAEHLEIHLLAVKGDNKTENIAVSTIKEKHPHLKRDFSECAVENEKFGTESLDTEKIARAMFKSDRIFSTSCTSKKTSENSLSGIVLNANDEINALNAQEKIENHDRELSLKIALPLCNQPHANDEISSKVTNRVQLTSGNSLEGSNCDFGQQKYESKNDTLNKSSKFQNRNAGNIKDNQPNLIYTSETKTDISSSFDRKNHDSNENHENNKETSKKPHDTSIECDQNNSTALSDHKEKNPSFKHIFSDTVTNFAKELYMNKTFLRQNSDIRGYDHKPGTCAMSTHDSNDNSFVIADDSCILQEDREKETFLTQRHSDYSEYTLNNAVSKKTSASNIVNNTKFSGKNLQCLELNIINKSLSPNTHTIFDSNSGNKLNFKATQRKKENYAPDLRMDFESERQNADNHIVCNVITQEPQLNNLKALPTGLTLPNSEIQATSEAQLDNRMDFEVTNSKVTSECMVNKPVRNSHVEPEDENIVNLNKDVDPSIILVESPHHQQKITSHVQKIDAHASIALQKAPSCIKGICPDLPIKQIDENVPVGALSRNHSENVAPADVKNTYEYFNHKKAPIPHLTHNPLAKSEKRVSDVIFSIKSPHKNDQISDFDAKYNCQHSSPFVSNIKSKSKPEKRIKLKCKLDTDDYQSNITDQIKLIQNKKIPKTVKVPAKDKVCINNKFYTKIKLIGKGGCGKVYLVLLDNEIFALKEIRKKGENESIIADYKNEIEFLTQLKDDPFIVQLIDFAENDTYIYILMEYGDCDLSVVIKSYLSERKKMERKLKEAATNHETENMDQNTHQNGFQTKKSYSDATFKTSDWSIVPINIMRSFWEQMLIIVDKIHCLKIVHRDLKPANFLLVKGRLKLIDFGIAKAIKGDTTNFQTQSQVGTINYMAPEALECDKKVGRSCDVWSLGCILYEMTYGKAPLHKCDSLLKKVRMLQDKNYVIDYPVLSSCTDFYNLRKTLKNCLQWNPKSRYTIKDLMNTSFVGRNALNLSENTVKNLVRNVLKASEKGATSEHAEKIYKKFIKDLEKR